MGARRRVVRRCRPGGAHARRSRSCDLRRPTTASASVFTATANFWHGSIWLTAARASCRSWGSNMASKNFVLDDGGGHGARRGDARRAAINDGEGAGVTAVLRRRSAVAATTTCATSRRSPRTICRRATTSSTTRSRSARRCARRRVNVNTLGEVPDSSWFTNRIGVRDMTIDEVLRGPDTIDGPAPGPWEVIGRPDRRHHAEVHDSRRQRHRVPDQARSREHSRARVVGRADLDEDLPRDRLHRARGLHRVARSRAASRRARMCASSRRRAASGS